MAIHISNFGSFSDRVKPYADQGGFVPEKGDKPEDFNFGHDNFVTDIDENGDGYEGYAAETWEDFLKDAVEATERASESAAAWREN